MMAVAYWGFHVPIDPWPANNLGVAAILYCFIFFYLFFAGPGAWSINRIREHRRRTLTQSTERPVARNVLPAMNEDRETAATNASPTAPAGWR
jgi:hypothetical protein